MPIYKWSKTAASNGNSDPTINYLEGQAPSSLNNSARAAMAAEAKFRDDISGTLTTTGSSTAYALATNSVFDTAANMSGAMLCFIPHATNGASPTLAVDDLTARAINQSTGVAVTAGQLVLGTPYVVTYVHASTEFILQGAIGATDTLQILSTDAGATVGPTLDLYRNSASPAVNDVIGSVDINGKNSTPAKKLYARVTAIIKNATAAAEDANVFLQAIVAGTLTTVIQNSGNSLLSAMQFTLSNATAALSLSGGATGSRSGSPTAGDTRYNTTLNGLEYWNGTAWIVLGQAPTVQRFTSGTSQTYTPGTGVVRIRVRMCGGGGGGSARITNNGAVGTDTSFGSWTAIHGNGGVVDGGAGGAGGTGGATGTGTLIDRADGASGLAGNGSSSANASYPGGVGGVNPFGGNGCGTAFNAAGGAARANTGAGGQGGGSSGNNAGSGGGAGEYVEFWVNGPSATTYTVGAGGNGGAAGTTAGGNGAAGIIIIEEFYS